MAYMSTRGYYLSIMLVEEPHEGEAARSAGVALLREIRLEVLKLTQCEKYYNYPNDSI